MSFTLLLNSWMLPQRILPWQEAITLWYLGKVDVLEAYRESVASPSISVPMPAVVRLRRHVVGVRKGVKFSRANVFARDGFACQYCGLRKARSELSFDHVVPRVAGGRTSWENIATACRPCNHKKRNRTPDQAGMKLLRKPVRPTVLPVEPLHLALGGTGSGDGSRPIPPEWSVYCGA